MQPRGATELQMEMLEKYVSKDLLDQVQICTSIPGKVPIDPNKLNILWQKNSWDQPNLQEFFTNKKRHDEYDWYIFNSHWNYEKFRYAFDIPTEKSVVIKNGIDTFPVRKIYKRGTPIKLIHHCTPWRGLNVLAGVVGLGLGGAGYGISRPFRRGSLKNKFLRDRIIQKILKEAN